MRRNRPRNGVNGHDRARLTPEQEIALKNMVLLSKADRQEVLDMVIMYELVEDRPEGTAIRAQLET